MVSLQIQTDDLNRLWTAENPIGKEPVGQNSDPPKDEAKDQGGEHGNDT